MVVNRDNIDMKSNSGEFGFTLLELVVVIGIICFLAVVALDRYYRLLIDVERTSMEHNLGVMRSAINMQVADRYVKGDMAGIAKLVDSNPMDHLAEIPANYLGTIDTADLQNLADLERGSWIFDAGSQTLIYLVRNRMYFQSVLEEPERARFKIFPVYSDRRDGEQVRQYLSGLRLQPLEPYQWLKPWE